MEDEVDPADFGMDGLTRMVGLDIEEIAVKLELEKKMIHPSQYLAILEDDNSEMYRK
jgi:hypothetical protein